MNNMRQIKTFLGCALVMLISVCTLSAQQAQESEEDQKGSRVYRATLFNQWGGPELYVKEKKGFSVIKPAKYSYTRPYKYKGNVIEFFYKTVNAEDRVVYQPVMQSKISPLIEEPLVIIVWDKIKKRPLAKAVEFSPNKFKYGSYQIVNFSGRPLAGYIGDKKNMIKCGSNQSKVTQFKFPHNAMLPMKFYASVDGATDKVFGSMTKHRENKRAVYLIYATRDKQGRIKYQSTVIVDNKKSES